MKKIGWQVLGALVVAIAVLALARPAHALPMFARKYGVACSTCHAPAAPRLNAVGFKFRRAGFRMPEQIGQDETSDFDLAHYFAAVAMVQYEVTQTSDKTVAPSTSQTANTFSMPELQLHPLTGSFARHFATRAQITLSPDEGVAVENAYARGTWGTRDMWFETRAGLMHPFEGFGASDFPIGVSTPLILVQGANFNQDTLYRIGDINRVGAEVGVQWMDTALSVMVTNTLTATGTGAEGTVRDTDNRKNFIVVAHQLIGNFSGVSAYWAHGWTNLPTDPVAFAAGTDMATWRNRFDRLALFGSIGNGTLFGYAGGAVGWDRALDVASGSQSLFRSAGGFVEGNVAVTSWAVPYVRGDYFDPALGTGNNQMWAATAGVGLHTQLVWVIPEFQYMNTAAELGHRRDTGAFLRAVAAY